MISIVTCIYNIGFKPIDFYNERLLRAVKNNPDINFIVFTSKDNEINRSLGNLEVRIREIGGLDKYGLIKNSKKYLTGGQKNSRTGMDGYLELNHSKIDLMNEVDNGYVYWMDAGLFSNDLFLEKHLNIPFNISQLINKDFLFMSKKHEHLYFHGLDTELLIKDGILIKDYDYVIGGFFGGKVNYVKELKFIYNDVLKCFLSNRMIPVDECIFSSINVISNFNKNITNIHFDQWYNEETRLYPKDVESPMIKGKSTFSDVFNKNFQIRMG